MRGRLSYSEYKLFKFRFKQQGLWTYFEKNAENFKTDYSKRILFEKSMESFARTLEKMGESGLISSIEYMQTAVSLALDGFSGTLWNADTFPDMVKPAPEHDVDAMSLFLLGGRLIEIGADGTVKKNNNVRIIPRTDGKSVLSATEKAILSGINVLAIADCGGYLNEEDPDKLAAETTKLAHKVNPKIQGTAYHNRSSNLVVNEKDREGSERFNQSALTKQQRLTLYFQPFTTGTDIKQSAQAAQMLTIGRTKCCAICFRQLGVCGSWPGGRASNSWWLKT